MSQRLPGPIMGRSGPAALVWGLLSGLAIAAAGWWPRVPGAPDSVATGFHPLGEALAAAVPPGLGRLYLDVGLLALFVALLTRWAMRAGTPPELRRLEPDFLVVVAFALVVHPAAAAVFVVGGFTGPLLAGSLILAAGQAPRIKGATWWAGGLVLVSLLTAPEAACLLPVLLFPVEEEHRESDRLFEGPLLATLLYLAFRWSVADPGGAGLSQGGPEQLVVAFLTAGHGVWEAFVPTGAPSPVASPVGSEVLGGWPSVLAVGAGACLGLSVIRDSSRYATRTRRLVRLVLLVGAAAALIPSGADPFDPIRWLLPTLFTVAAGLTVALRSGRAASSGVWLAASLLVGSHLAVSLRGERPRPVTARLSDVAVVPLPPNSLEVAALLLEDAEAALTRYDYYTARVGLLPLLETSPHRYRVLRGLVVANAGLGDVPLALARTRECLLADAARTRLEITTLLQPFFDDSSLSDEGLEYLEGLDGLWSEEAWMQANFALLSERTGDLEAAARYRRREAELKGSAPR